VAVAQVFATRGYRGYSFHSRVHRTPPPDKKALEASKAYISRFQLLEFFFLKQSIDPPGCIKPDFQSCKPIALGFSVKVIVFRQIDRKLLKSEKRAKRAPPKYLSLPLSLSSSLFVVVTVFAMTFARHGKRQCAVFV